jgi:hypothetical protein
VRIQKEQKPLTITILAVLSLAGYEAKTAQTTFMSSERFYILFNRWFLENSFKPVLLCRQTATSHISEKKKLNSKNRVLRVFPHRRSELLNNL